MKNWNLAITALLLSQRAAAHPRHGMPGSLHPHAGDYGLVLLAVAVVVIVLYALRKERRKK